VYKHKGKQAKRLSVSCWRVYDHDLPEFPLCVELYENKIYVAEYKRRHGMSEEEHDAWLEESEKIILPSFLSVDEENIFIRACANVNRDDMLNMKKVNEVREFFTVKEKRVEFFSESYRLFRYGFIS